MSLVGRAGGGGRREGGREFALFEGPLPAADGNNELLRGSGGNTGNGAGPTSPVIVSRRGLSGSKSPEAAEAARSGGAGKDGLEGNIPFWLASILYGRQCANRYIIERAAGMKRNK